MSETPNLLAGVRVLELARTLAGPWMGQLLADMGADVVKAERRGVGDETRSWGPPFVADDDGQPVFSAYFLGCNRGKRSVEVDLKNPDDRALLRRLITSADIVIDNFKVGTLERHGLGPRTLCAENPRLIWCSITAFGQTGPYAERPGYDFVIQAMSGLLALNGSGPSLPRRMPIPTSDLFTGVYGALTALAALTRRNATGQGAFIDLSLFDTQVSTLSLHLLGHLFGGAGTPQNLHAVVPQIVVPTSDGHLALVITTDVHSERLFSGLGLTALARDSRFVSTASRRANVRELERVLSDRTSGLTTAELVVLLAGLDVPAGPVNSVQDVLADAQAQERGLVTSTPDDLRTPLVRLPALFDGTAAISARTAPRLGQHNDDVVGDRSWGGPPPPA